MILGTITFVALAIIVIVTILKLWNVTRMGDLYPDFFKYIGFAAVFFSWLFLLIVVNTNVHAASADAIYNSDLFEASQYLSFANSFLWINMFLLFAEVIVGWKGLLPRGRLKKA